MATARQAFYDYSDEDGRIRKHFYGRLFAPSYTRSDRENGYHGTWQAYVEDTVEVNRPKFTILGLLSLAGAATSAVLALTSSPANAVTAAAITIATAVYTASEISNAEYNIRPYTKTYGPRYGSN